MSKKIPCGGFYTSENFVHGYPVYAISLKGDLVFENKIYEDVMNYKTSPSFEDIAGMDITEAKEPPKYILYAVTNLDGETKLFHIGDDIDSDDTPVVTAEEIMREGAYKFVIYDDDFGKFYHLDHIIDGESIVFTCKDIFVLLLPDGGNNGEVIVLDKKLSLAFDMKGTVTVKDNSVSLVANPTAKPI